MPDVIQHYIRGRVVESTSGRTGEVYNPAIGEVIRRVAFASAAEVRQAVEADPYQNHDGFRTIGRGTGPL